MFLLTPDVSFSPSLKGNESSVMWQLEDLMASCCLHRAVGMSAVCRASDLYLSLIIFSNTALAFVFAESVRWHLMSLTSHLMSLRLVSEIPLLFLSLTLNLLCAQLPVSSPLFYFYLLNKIRYIHIFFSDVGTFSTESNYMWSKKCSSIAWNKIQTISRRLNLHFLQRISDAL